MSYAKMMRKPMRARINAYRKSGAMFGQTFHSGTCGPERYREHTCAMLEVSRWFRIRNEHENQRYARECIRESISSLRAIRSKLALQAAAP